MSDNRTQWADLATRGILSEKERESARQELLDHMEDHMETMLAVGFSPEDAEAHAILAMGDPKETAALLRAAHQPVLTRMLQICRVATIFLAVVVLWNICISPDNLRWNYFSSPATEWVTSTAVPREVPLNKTFRLGDYTLEMTSASIYHGNIFYVTYLFLEVTPDRFWQDAPVLQGTYDLWVDGQLRSNQLDEEQGLIMEGFGRRLNTFHGRLYFETQQEPQQLTLHFTDAEQIYSEDSVSFTLDLDLTGGTIYEEAE